ncbi:MAG: imidazole glycerol phosphate synthase subunit HisH [Actinomycetaceae bacterium]|nr:imidazole glycerol phosphate synthase subunit HisH [Actinomycetaceae bacterium]
MKKHVAVLNYGSGNVRSAVRALEHVGLRVDLTADVTTVLEADGLVVPGVGAFASVMHQLESVQGPSLIDRRLIANRPVLGICVGLQVMFERSTEHDGAEGLGQWPGEVIELDAQTIPHMGWSEVRPPHASTLFAGVEDQRFYFVHSYAVTNDPTASMDGPLKKPLVTWAHHGVDFVAAVENGPLSATQFHPEKSGEAGLVLLENWAHTL